MSPFRHQASHQPLADPLELRCDARQRDAVAHAVAMLADSGVMPAVEYLKSQAVRARVIERVLLDPTHRRAAA